MPREHQQRTEVWDYVAVVRRNLLLVIAVTAAVIISALVLTRLQSPVYTSEGRLLVQQGASVFSTTDKAVSADFVQTEIQFLESEGVRDLVWNELGSAPKVSAVQVGTTSVVAVTAEGPTAQKAKATVDAYMQAYLDFRRQTTTDGLAATSRQVQAAIDDLQKQIDSLSTQLRSVSCPPSGGCPEATAVEQDRDARVQEQVPFRQKLSQLNIDSSSTTVGAVVVPAGLPSSPSSPKPARNGAMGLVLGALLGVGLALLFEFRDDSVRDVEDVERCTRDVTVLAAIPPPPARNDRSRLRVMTLSSPTSPTAEAYCSLRTSIRFLGVDRQFRSILVTSADHSEGRTMTAANLAVVLAGAGERVFMVDCDLRRPRLHEYFGISNDVGFTSVLLDEATVAEALQPVTEDGRLWLLPAGPLPPNPSDLLSSVYASEVLADLESQAAVLVIDCPPLLTVSDAAILSAKVGGTLLVVRSGVSSRKRLTSAVDLLNQIGAPMLGTVFHTTSGAHAAGDGYWVGGAHPLSPSLATGTESSNEKRGGALRRASPDRSVRSATSMTAASDWPARAARPSGGEGPCPSHRLPDVGRTESDEST